MTTPHTQDASIADVSAAPRTPREVEVDRYEVIAEIGEGGIGRVMRAHDRRLNREVALKLLRRLSAEHEARFFAEAELTARLEHPAIVPVHDVGRWHTGEPFYAMKLVTGDSLKDVIARHATLAGRLTLLPNVLTICDAVAYAHSQGVIHRDLKPSNVMVGSFGETVVIDWGLARLAEAPDAPAVVGTPHYMAPEQARGQAADARSDVYALGAVLYELLGGRAPYDGESDVLGKAVSTAPQPLPAEVPPPLIAIVQQAMQRTASDRYADARALGADLRRYLEGQLVAAHRYSAWQRLVRLVTRNKPLTAALLVLLAGAAYSFVRIVSERDAARSSEARAEKTQAAAELRRDQLLLSQARLWLEKDPTVAFAWLQSFAATASATPRTVSQVAADALSRGVATQLTHGRKLVVLSPDEKTLAAWTGEKLVKWSVDRADTVTLGTPLAKVSALCFSEDGRALFAGEGTRLRRWSLEGAEPSTLVDLPEPITLVTARGGRLLIGGEGGTIWQHDAAGLRELGRLQSRIYEGTQDAEWAAIADVDDNFIVVRLADGKTVLTGTGQGYAVGGGAVSWGATDGTVFVTDLATGKKQSFAHEHEGQVAATVLNGKQLISMGQDHTVVVRDLQSGTKRVLGSGAAWMLHGVLSADGALLLTLCQDHTARVWDLATGTSWVLEGHSAPFRTYGFMGAHHVVTGDAEGEVRVWRTPTVRSVALLNAHTSQYEEARALPDGEVVSAGEDGVLQVWDPSGGSPRHTLKETGSGGSLSVAGGRVCNAGGGGAWVREAASLDAPPLALETGGEVHQAALSPDGTKVAIAATDHTIRLYDLPDVKGRVLGKHDAAAWHVAFSPDQSWLASAGDDLPIRLWSLKGEAPRVLPGPEALTFDLQFSPDGRWLAAAGIDSKLHLWSVPAFEPHTLEGHRSIVRALAFSADGRRIATVSDDHTARLWRLDALDREPLVLEHAAQVAAALFARDGKSLVTADSDAIWRWDVETGALLSVDREHLGTLSGLAASSDGRALISAAEDHAVRYWPRYFEETQPPGDAAALARLSSVVLRDDVAGSK